MMYTQLERGVNHITNNPQKWVNLKLSLAWRASKRRSRFSCRYWKTSGITSSLDFAATWNDKCRRMSAGKCKFCSSAVLRFYWDRGARPIFKGRKFVCEAFLIHHAALKRRPPEGKYVRENRIIPSSGWKRERFV